MAYYSNPYYGYYPQMQPMLPMVYPQQQVVEQPQQNLNVQAEQTSNNMNSLMVWVQGKAGAQSYPVARGTTLPLFDSEGDFVYIKSVDNNGYMRGRSGRMMPYNRGSSYEGGNGYSRTDNKEMMLSHLQNVADMATDERDRRAVEKLMQQMEQQ